MQRRVCTQHLHCETATAQHSSTAHQGCDCMSGQRQDLVPSEGSLHNLIPGQLMPFMAAVTSASVRCLRGRTACAPRSSAPIHTYGPSSGALAATAFRGSRPHTSDRQSLARRPSEPHSTRASPLSQKCGVARRSLTRASPRSRMLVATWRPLCPSTSRRRIKDLRRRRSRRWCASG